MNLTRNGVTITVDDAEITRMVLERLAGSATPTNLRGIAIPKLGEYWAGQGGIFTGIGVGRDGSPDQLVITAKDELDPGDWNKLLAGAADFTADGHHDFTMPFRTEQSLQYANLRGQFKEEAYWSCEQRREVPDYAWYQDFGFGGQNYDHKGIKARGVAVRRIPITVIQ